MFTSSDGSSMTSFHTDLLRAGKDYEQQKNKPKGTYKSDWKTSVDDQTVKDSDGKVTHTISSHKTEMSSSYSHGNGCAIF